MRAFVNDESGEDDPLAEFPPAEHRLITGNRALFGVGRGWHSRHPASTSKYYIFSGSARSGLGEMELETSFSPPVETGIVKPWRWCEAKAHTQSDLHLRPPQSLA